MRPDQPEQDTSGPDGRTVAEKPVIRLGFVSQPELHVYRPKGNPSDTAVLICPGGGYSILAWDLEGTEIAQWLQGIGVTAIVVKYRVPTRTSEPKWLAPVQDIQRSVSLVRSGAIEGVSPKRIGVLGFSAGGNASARVATAAQRHYELIDAHDEASATPDFAVLVYPAWLVRGDDETKLIEELEVTKDSPPMFFRSRGRRSGQLHEQRDSVWQPAAKRRHIIVACICERRTRVRRPGCRHTNRCMAQTCAQLG